MPPARAGWIPPTRATAPRGRASHSPRVAACASAPAAAPASANTGTVPPAPGTGSPVTCSACPSRTAKIGMPFSAAAEAMPGNGSMTAVATETTRTASTPGSARTADNAEASTSGGTTEEVSTGFAVAAPLGSSLCSLRCVRSDSGATMRPRASHASAASTPIPPAFETTAVRRPAGTRCQDRAATSSMSSSSRSTARTPACRNSASRVARGVAVDAVCEAAARCPAAELPDRTVRTGMRSASRRAKRENLRGLPNDSRCSTAMRVRSSPCHHSSMSLPLTSYLSPVDTAVVTPNPRRPSSVCSAIATPPDWVTSPTAPAGAGSVNVASSRTAGSVLVMPRQFGPTIRMS